MPGATRTAHVACQSFTPNFTGANTAPQRSLVTGEAPQSPFGAPLQRGAQARLPIQPRTTASPTSRRGTGAAAAAHSLKDPE